jgi:hypothetical protein
MKGHVLHVLNTERVDNLIAVGNKTFKNWSEAKSFAKILYDKYKFEGGVLSEEDKMFFYEALKLRGARGLEKIGCGINKIFIRANGYGKTHCGSNG